MSDMGYRPAYNLQYAVDTEKNIIVGVGVTNNGSDGGQMLPMYEKIEKKLGGEIKRYLADGGFKNKPDIERMTKNGCEVFVPVTLKNRSKKIDDPFVPKENESKEIGEWRIRMGKEESKTIYKKRAATIELVNANHRQRNLYQLSVKGLKRVSGIACMFAVVYNMMRTISLGYM